MKNINGPKDGLDKHCGVEIKLSRKSKVVITQTSEDLYQSVHQTTNKAARTALQQLKRRRTLGLKHHLKNKELFD